MNNNEILPIDRDKLSDEVEIQGGLPEGFAKPIGDDKVKDLKNNSEDEKEEEVEEEEEEDKPKKEIFVKPKKKSPVEISKRTGKPKRKLTEKQLENLAKAREKSRAKRKALAEVNAVEKAKKKELRKQKQQEKIIKKEEQDALIDYKAKLELEAEKKAHWDEDRLQELIYNSIDKYIEKKKSMKPTPKVHIPNQNPYPQYPPTAPQNQGYYNHIQPTYVQPPPQQQQAPPQPNYAKRYKDRNPVNDLFGNFN